MKEKERYGITDDHYLCDSAIFNTVTNERLRLYQICDILNQQDKRIKECEEQLSTATMYHGCEALVNELKQKKPTTQRATSRLA